jgi:hypothetical protein
VYILLFIEASKTILCNNMKKDEGNRLGRGTWN